jgi:hypothetical protein
MVDFWLYHVIEKLRLIGFGRGSMCQGLLMKYLHKFFNKHDDPWVMLVWDKYYLNGAPHAKKSCGY